MNRVYEGTRGLVLSVGESFNRSLYQQTPTPDFYFSELRFFGTSAADSLWPHLRITYTLTGGLEEGSP